MSSDSSLVADPADQYETTKTFAELGVVAALADALAAKGIVKAFPIQAMTIHDALAGRDVCGKAKTGSGKTLGFGLPMLQRVASDETYVRVTDGPARPLHPYGASC